MSAFQFGGIMYQKDLLKTTCKSTEKRSERFAQMWQFPLSRKATSVCKAVPDSKKSSCFKGIQQRNYSWSQEK